MTYPLSMSSRDVVIDDGDLRMMLPPLVAERVDDELLRDSWSAAALRLLATIRNPFWHSYVGEYQIDWDGVLAEARNLDREANSVTVRAELAASLAGRPGARVNLMTAGRVLDRANYAAFLDAQRILLEGLAS